jgi:hypothetical protein
LRRECRRESSGEQISRSHHVVPLSRAGMK